MDYALMKSENDIPQIIPTNMDKVELFNKLADTAPVADLTGKKFKISGLIPERVDLPADTEYAKKCKAAKKEYDGEYRERFRLTILTDVGEYHSFSTTLNRALVRAMALLGDEFFEKQYEISAKINGTGDEARALYILKIFNLDKKK